MSTKTLVNEFTKDHKRKDILGCEFVPISSRIRFGNEKNIIKTKIYNYSKVFDLNNNDEQNLKIVEDYILSKPLEIIKLVEIMTRVLVDNQIVILLCSENEWKTKYIIYVGKVIEKLFHYPIINYKKDKNKSFHYDPSDVAKQIGNMEKYATKILLKQKQNREKALKLMTKKEMKKTLKKLGLYYDGMDKYEMKETLEVFYVDKGE